MSGVFQVVPAENYLVRPFRTHKTQAYDLTYLSGSNITPVSVDLAVVPPTLALWQFNPNTSAINSASGLFRETLYASVRHIFYASSSQFNDGVALPCPSGNLVVFSIAQPSYGERIKPGSVTLELPNLPRIFTDDGFGGLITTASGSTVLGHIFYDMGVAILPSTAFPLGTGSAIFVEFDATHTIYEHQIICTMEPGVGNYSFNPSMKITGSLDGVKVIDKFASGTLTPYFTTVGCYTSKGELVAIGKVPRPIKRAVESQQSVIVRFDV